MDSLERLLLYRKKLILPRIYQVINWFMWITYFCAILFLATLVYEHGFMISSDEAKAIRIIYKSVWIVFLLSVWGIERSGFFNGREKWAKGFENQRV